MEAIMKIDTPLHADHQLDQLAAQFEYWRQTRSHRGERIPQALWEQAVALARILPHSRVAQHLRLAPNDLKKHMAMQVDSHVAPCRTMPGFIEVPSATSSAQVGSTIEMEVQRPDGARLRLHAPATALTAIVKSFLEV
jgi:hypothetical protein